MKYVLALMVALVTLFIGMIILEEKYIKNLPEDNKFKKWWRRNLIGELGPDEDY